MRHAALRLARWSRLLALAVACGTAFAPAQATASSGADVSLVGTTLGATLADGTFLQGRELVGRQLLVPAGDRRLPLRIDAVERDATVPGLFLYELLLQDDTGQWQNICTPDRDGRRWAIPLAGQVSDDGRFEPDPGKLAITCTSGVQGKCLRAGYRYWNAAGDVDRARLQQFQACTRLYRADYCGDGRGWTEDGTLIDLYDDAGLQSPQPRSGLLFEAGWTPEGAVCVHHTRVAGKIRLGELLARCPRLAKAPSGRECTEARARRLGAILFNKSRAAAR